jgi:hypothetical protein
MIDWLGHAEHVVVSRPTASEPAHQRHRNRRRRSDLLQRRDVEPPAWNRGSCSIEIIIVGTASSPSPFAIDQLEHLHWIERDRLYHSAPIASIDSWSTALPAVWNSGIATKRSASVSRARDYDEPRVVDRAPVRDHRALRRASHAARELDLRDVVRIDGGLPRAELAVADRFAECLQLRERQQARKVRIAKQHRAAGTSAAPPSAPRLAPDPQRIELGHDAFSERHSSCRGNRPSAPACGRRPAGAGTELVALVVRVDGDDGAHFGSAISSSTHSGTFVASTATLSPALTPVAIKPFASVRLVAQLCIRQSQLGPISG